MKACSNEVNLEKAEMVIIDSGASDHARNPERVPRRLITESDGSRTGVKYMAANGERIRNEGQAVMQGVTMDGSKTKTTYQLARVNKTLLSTSRICAAGNTIVMRATNKESYIMNDASGNKLPIHQMNGVFVMPLWVGKGQEKTKEPMQKARAEEKQSPVARQSR